VIDAKNSESLCLTVRDDENTLDVFHHPFAYAAHRGITTSGGRATVGAEV
jgi:hypothetical protein